MKNISNQWYKILGALCLFLLIVMLYRREARISSRIDSLEARLTAIEIYAHGLNSRSTGQPASATRVDATNDATATGNIAQKSRSKDIAQRKDIAQKSAKDEATGDGAGIAQKVDRQEVADDGGKFRQVARLELNTVDSATLVRVSGIGGGTARAILLYREKLGGYYSAEQLREKLTWDGAQSRLDDWCANWFWADERLIQKLRINELSFKELVRHPYLEFDDVKAIVRWRERHKAVRNAAELSQLGIDDSAKLDRLLHYVEF